MRSETIRTDFRVIQEMVKARSTVLDLGCGEGELMSILAEVSGAKVQGIEINEQLIYKCVARGLSVLHGDIDSGLTDYANRSFDYVILNQSFQQVLNPDFVLHEALRVAREVIVSFPNFAHYSVRLQIALKGRTPVTASLPYEWYNTPNLHFLSVSDFFNYCSRRGIQITKAVFVDKHRRVRIFPNLLASTGIFKLKMNRTGGQNGE